MPKPALTLIVTLLVLLFTSSAYSLSLPTQIQSQTQTPTLHSREETLSPSSFAEYPKGQKIIIYIVIAICSILGIVMLVPILWFCSGAIYDKLTRGRRERARILLIERRERDGMPRAGGILVGSGKKEIGIGEREGIEMEGAGKLEGLGAEVEVPGVVSVQVQVELNVLV